jgi:CheY-like chemotaxis protein
MKQLLVFVDDDPSELETFIKLYEDERIEIVPVHAPSSPDALPQIKDMLNARQPDLFVLDMFLPTSQTALTRLSKAALKSGMVKLDGLRQSIVEIETVTHDGKELLRRTQGLVARAEALVKVWCEELGQSPRGGIALLQELDTLYPDTPKLFYSRKATVEDVKLALAAGALDVIRKPDPSSAVAATDQIVEAFLAASVWQAPGYLSKWHSALGDNVQM